MPCEIVHIFELRHELASAFLTFTSMSQALIDRPDEERRVISFNRLRLTDLKIDVPRLAAKKVLAKAFADGGNAALLH